MPSKMDHVADAATGGKELYRLSTLYPFPVFVKQANPEIHLAVPPGTTTANCADPRNAQFWCHTKISTWLSHLFYAEKRAEFHPKDRAQIEKRLDQFATYHHIQPECAQIKSRYEELHKEATAALPDSMYAYVWQPETGQKVRQYPLRSAMEVKAAADWFVQYRDQIPFEKRRVMAGKILEKAAAYGAGLGDAAEALERANGRGVCDPAKVVDMIEKRALLVPAAAGVTVDEEGKQVGCGLREQFRKMAATVRSMPRKALQPQMLVKLAQTVDTLDRQLGLVASYGKGISRPEDVIFEATFTKAASELAAHVATTTGKYYEKKAFRRLPLADVEALFGSDFAGRVKTPLGEIDAEKMAEEAATLPRPDAQLLDGLLSENGIAPVMHKAAASRRGFNEQQMAVIASHYG